MFKGSVVFLTYVLAKKVHIVALILIVLTLVSMLSLFVIAGIESLTRVFDIFYPIDETPLATLIITSDALSPFTSLVDLNQVEQILRGIEGVEIYPVFITIGFVDKKLVVIYEMPGVDDGCAFLDRDLLENVRGSWGGYIPVYSVFTQKTVFLKICGEGVKPGVGVSHNTIATIRGVSPRYYSFVIVKIYNRSSIEEVYKAVFPDAWRTDIERLVRRALLLAVRFGKDVSIKSIENPTQLFLARLGIHKDLLIYLAYSVAVISFLSLPILGIGVVEGLRRDIEVFSGIGAPKTSIGVALLLLFTILTVTSNAVSYMVLQCLQPSIEFLGYVIPLTIDVESLPLISLALLTLCIIGALMGLRALEI